MSPLLANIYLDKFDWWIAKQWENKKTKREYSSQGGKIAALKKTNLIPMYLVRYCDDWVIITNTKENANKIKGYAEKFLEEKMNLKLSVEKTVITDVRKNNITFLGYEYKVVKGNSKTGYITRTRPNRIRLKLKVRELTRYIKDGL